MGVLGTLKSSVGLGSGIEIQSLVDQLVDLEGKYVTENLDKDELSVQAKITAFGNLKGALSDFKDSVNAIRTASTFEEHSTSVSNDPTSDAATTYFTASSTSSAVPASYTVEVEQIAKAHKMSKDFTTSSQVVGTGTLRIVVGQGQSVSTTVDYTINSENNSVDGIKNLINSTTNQTGIVASTIVSDAGVKLIISAKETGVKNTLGISVLSDSDSNLTDDSGLSQLTTANMTEVSAALDSNIRIDGQLITSAKSILVDVIDGITLDLKKAEDGKIHDLKINVDQSKIKDKVKNYVEKYNDVMNLIKELTTTNSTHPELAGDLVNDANMRTIDSRLRRTLTTSKSTPSGLNTLANIGITTNIKTGELLFDDDKYSKATNSNVSDLVMMFTGVNGVASLQYDELDAFLNSDGVVSKASDKLNAHLKEITVEKAEHILKLEKKRIFLTLKFASLDGLLGQLQSLSNFVSTQFASSVEPLSFKK